MRPFLKPMVLATALAAAVTSCATTTSPTGRRQMVGAVSEAQLAQLGEQAFAEARAKMPQSRDARTVNYVNCVVGSLVRQLPADWQRLRWEAAVFQDDEANAFALPGGKVGVNTGIFKVARNQDQLAGVIAHEIGHVYAHHHNERITRQMGAQFGVQLAQILAGSRYGQGAMDAVGQGGSILAQTGLLLPGSRTQELEADVIGQELMAKAGYDPHGAVALWQNMAAAGGARPPQWLSTHPDPNSRLREMQARADQLTPTFQGARQAGNNPRCG